MNLASSVAETVNLSGRPAPVKPNYYIHVRRDCVAPLSVAHGGHSLFLHDKTVGQAKPGYFSPAKNHLPVETDPSRLPKNLLRRRMAVSKRPEKSRQRRSDSCRSPKCRFGTGRPIPDDQKSIFGTGAVFLASKNRAPAPECLLSPPPNGLPHGQTFYFQQLAVKT